LRYANTASIRRLSSSEGGIPSLLKMLLMCLLTAFSGDEEPAGDRHLGAALDHERQHLAFLWGERAERLVGGPAGKQLRDDIRVHDGAARRDLPHRVDELAHVGYPILEQVADAAIGVGEQLSRVQLLDMLGKHQDG
jgi:hypothetical protein